ncbi:putative membrane-associated kinase regulator 4 [Apium graveolens]|uniref:putative membrane-associated kinase regulator 4 n=1 Tax=Apium graveolens TaxID=4045 RepID=UPI003D7A64D6
MTTNFHSDDHEEEDYIEMELSSHSDRFVGVMSSTTHPPLDFEFQMYSSSLKRCTTISPADELFYKGKLLPLHLPPRLQMVEKLLQNSKSYDTDTFEELLNTPLANNTPAFSAPVKPRNISPSESWQFSRDQNPEENFDELPTEMSGFVGSKTRKSWTRKLKLVKQASLSSKLKFSRSYFRSLFAKPGCSDESSNDDHIIIAKNPFQNIQTEGYEMQPKTKSFAYETSSDTGARSQHRRSFSGSTSFGSFYKSSSSSASERCHKLQPLNRSSSTNPDIENSIQGAIAHCKRSSQQQLHSRKYGSDMGFFSSSASRIVNEDHEREELCRG